MGLYFGGLPIFGLFSKDPVSEKFLQMSITVDLGICNNLVCLRESTLCIKSTKTLLASASNFFTYFSNGYNYYNRPSSKYVDYGLSNLSLFW